MQKKKRRDERYKIQKEERVSDLYYGTLDGKDPIAKQ